MTVVSLTGQLICADDTEAQLVERYLPDHITLTRAEPGCLSFDVERVGTSRVWQVNERFQNADAFAAHQERVATSVWGQMTTGIERRYVRTDES